MFDIVCYLGGTGGDLIVAMIDSTGVTIENSTVQISRERQGLKKSWQFQNDNDRNLYVEQMRTQYKSIPSHDPEYHLRNKQSFIAVVVNRKSTAEWAANRFKNLHRPHVWQEMQSVNNADSIEKYTQDILDWSSWIKQHTEKTISLEDILNGCACEALSSIITIESAGVNLYNQWLQVQNEISNHSHSGRG